MKHTLSLLTLSATFAVAQTGGVLAPTAAPGQTMKSLDQVEARTPIIDGAPGVSINPTTGTVTINQRGSYYLIDNLTVVDGNGITLNSDGVTLDLNGYTISSTTANAAHDAIEINGGNIRIFNGHIISGVTYNSSAEGDQFTGSGFDHGIHTSSGLYLNLHVHDVSVLGCDINGIYLRNTESSMVERCSIHVVGGYGIDAAFVKNCTVSHAGSVGISTRFAESCISQSYGSSAINCYSANHCRGISNSDNVSAEGIYALHLIHNSYGYASRGDGLEAHMVYNSYGRSASDVTTAAGIDAANLADGCYGQSSGGPGIESYRVTNSYGTSTGGEAGVNSITYGIRAIFSVFNSYGISVHSDGINAETVSYSKGHTHGVDTGDAGIDADLAIGCRTIGGELITTKYLMP